MFLLLLLLILLLGVHVLKQTLFKRSKCKGNVPMAGKTVIVTGERVTPSSRGGVAGRTVVRCGGVSTSFQRRFRTLRECSETKILKALTELGLLLTDG